MVSVELKWFHQSVTTARMVVNVWLSVVTPSERLEMSTPMARIVRARWNTHMLINQ